MSTLHVFTMISNPVNYQTRYKLFKDFEKEMQDYGVTLWVAELQYGNRPFVVTNNTNPRHLQLRPGQTGLSYAPIWSKENVLNLLVAKAIAQDPSIEYMGFFDADISFAGRTDWPQQIIDTLQFHEFIQPWSHCVDMGPQGTPLDKKPQIGFAYAWCNNMPMDWNKDHYATGTGHPGYAFCCTRKAFDALGGLIDFAILGSADRHMWYALVDKVMFSVNPKVHPIYKKKLKIWNVRARHYINRNIGYVPGLISHAWHGKKSDRRYKDRWQILVEHQFNPDVDLKRDANGLYILTERSWRLRRDILNYFKVRNEDSIDV